MIDTHATPGYRHINESLEIDRAMKAIGFTKFGKFSGVNAAIESALDRHFPEYGLDILDLREAFRNHPLGASQQLVETIAQAGIGLLGGGRSLKDNIVHHLLRTTGTRRFFDKRVGEKYGGRKDIVFTLQTQSMWNAKTDGIPNFIYTDHAALTNLHYTGFEIDRLPPAAWIAAERRAFKEATAIFTMSDHVRHSLIELYHCPEDKVVNVRAGTNTASVPDKANPREADNKTIVFVGVEWQRKGGPELVAAFENLPERHRDARLVIVGCAPDLNDSRISVIGRVPLADMPAIYARGAIFCMPSRVEPFGIVFIEAMRHSLAVVAPAHGAMPDYIENGRTGLLHPPGDVAAITDALVFLLDHPEERQAIAARGFDAVARTYTWDAVGARMRQEIQARIPFCAPDKYRRISDRTS